MLICKLKWKLFETTVNVYTCVYTYTSKYHIDRCTYAYVHIQIVQDTCTHIHAWVSTCCCMSDCAVEFGQHLQLLDTVDHPHVGSAGEGVKLEANSQTIALMELHVLQQS